MHFYIYWNDDYTKLTLTPGQEVALSYGGPCEEGYSYTAEVFRHAGDGVTCETHTQASDCDGPMEHHYEGFCRADRLALRPAYGDEQLLLPEWGRVAASQRDIYAEAMGY